MIYARYWISNCGKNSKPRFTQLNWYWISISTIVMCMSPTLSTLKIIVLTIPMKGSFLCIDSQRFYFLLLPFLTICFWVLLIFTTIKTERCLLHTTDIKSNGRKRYCSYKLERSWKDSRFEVKHPSWTCLTSRTWCLDFFLIHR